MDDINWEDLFRSLHEDFPSVYPESPSWLSPFTEDSLPVPKWDNPAPKPFYPYQRGMPPSGPTVAVENRYEAQNPPEDKKTPLEEKEDWMNQLLMSALMAGGRRGKQAPSSYGVGAQVTPGEPWRMRRDWEQDYRYLK